MRLSIIVGTRNRAYALTRCLDSIVASIGALKLSHDDAHSPDCEILLVDNGSTDDTKTVAEVWAQNYQGAFQYLSEPKKGLARAQNRALRQAAGDLIVFTDDDCCLSESFLIDAVRHDAADTVRVIRGGRIELGDLSDLPFTINLSDVEKRWTLEANSARHDHILGRINGCNMVMRRSLIDEIGMFDERFGPGSIIGSGNDSDYLMRCYLRGVALVYVPNMTVVHFHGRKTPEDGLLLMRRYSIGAGALYAKHLFKHGNFWRPLIWDLKKLAKDVISRQNTCLPLIGFTYPEKLRYTLFGMMKFVLAYASGHRKTVARS